MAELPGNAELKIHWPERYLPEKSHVHAVNELTMDAPLENIWAWLVRAPLWPTWYVNSSKVKILEGPATDLALATKFRWKTFGASITSTVLEYVPGERLSWDAHGFGIDTYHAWVLQTTPNGIYVRTEEVQHGWVAHIAARLTPNRMHRYHQIWLEELEKKAREGLPPES